MDEFLAEKGSRRRILGHQPVVLDDSNTVRVLSSGAVAVFASRMVDGRPVGARQLLFRLRPGQALFGAAPGEGEQGLLAVAVKESELAELGMEQFAELAVEVPGAVRDLVDDWAALVVGAMDSSDDQPHAVTRAAGESEVTLEDGACLLAARESRVCVDVGVGELQLFGESHLSIAPDSGSFPLPPGAWLRAEARASVTTRPSSAIDAEEELLACLPLLHRLLGRHLHVLKDRQEESDRRLLEARTLKESELLDSTLGELASVLETSERPARRESELLTAAAELGRELGVEISAPAESENTSRLAEPLEAIARASRLRVRKVVLPMEWWCKDSGPLLAEFAEDGRPVALLAGTKANYELFDPRDMTRVPVTPELASQLSPEAQVLYPPLPERVRGAFGLLRFALAQNGGNARFVALTGMMTVLLGFVTPVATATLIDKAIPGADRGLILQLALVMFAAALGAAAMTLAQGFVMLRTSIHADVRAQSATWDRLLRLRPSFFRHHPSGDLLDRAQSVRAISSELSSAAVRTILVGLASTLNLALLLHFSPELTLVALAAGTAILAVALLSARMLRSGIRDLQELQGAYFGLVVQLISGVGKLRMAGAIGRGFANWVRQYSRQLHLNLRTQALQDRVTVFNQFVPVVATASLYFLAGEMIAGSAAGAAAAVPPAEAGGEDELLTIGGFLAFSAAFSALLAGLTGLSTTVVGMLDVLLKGERMRPLLTEPRESAAGLADPGRLRGGLEVRNVVFRYRSDGAVTLDDVSLRAEPGEFIGIMGHSGSGKSTLLRLLLGFETPTEGAILYDGQDLAGLDVLAVRRQLGTVLQAGRLNAGSIRENVCAGLVLSLDEIWSALEDAGLASDVRDMPMGLDTLVSDGGGNLSGGQRQRLLLATALAHEPPILLLDEATSALDNPTQAAVSRALERRRVTRIVVAHRLSTIEHADRIYVLDRGEVVQVGTYAELAEQDGPFRRSIARQVT